MVIFFDLDGTLIDTEKYYRIFWPKAFAAHGYTLTDEQALSLRSLGRPYAPERMKRWFGADFDYAAVRGTRRAMMEGWLDENGGAALRPGAKELLQYLKEHGHIAVVATATDTERTQKYIRQTGIDSLITRIVSATMVKRGKPAPDIYLYACEQMGAEPSDCFAVEDAPNGVISAYTAGCRVIMVPDQTQPDDTLKEMLFARAASLTDIIPILENADS